MAHPSGAGQPPTVGEQGSREEGPNRRPAEDFAKQILQSAAATDLDAEAVIRIKPAVSEPCHPKVDSVASDDATQQSWTSGHLPASRDLLAKPAKQFREEKSLACHVQAAARPPKRGSDHSPVQPPAKAARRPDAAVHAEGQRLATAVEVFSGTGILSRALMSHGFQTMAVDHQPRSSLVPVVRLDLCKDSRQQLLQEELSANHPDTLHLAPPCGTSSRAREKPIPKRLARMGVPTPQPLRSGLHPMGLPSFLDARQCGVRESAVSQQAVRVLLQLDGLVVAK